MGKYGQYHLVMVITFVKLYKYRSFEKIEFALDIILNERLYCAPHKDLNDPFEGMFSTVELRHGGFRPHRLRGPLTGPTLGIFGRNYYENVINSIEQIPSLGNNVRVCSLSKELFDIRMWTHYASGHTGCAIELEFNEEPNLYEVSYSPGLKRFAEQLNENAKASDILSFKTDQWEYEKEYRIISSESHILIPKKITAIYLGIRVQDIHKELIIRSVPEGIPVYETMLNVEKVAISPKKQIN